MDVSELQLLQLAGVLLALSVLIFLALRLTRLHVVLVPKTQATVGPLVLLRKTLLTMYGAVFLVFSRDKIPSKELKKARAGDDVFAGNVEREVRVIFIRHGESVWNYVFNRGFGPSFLVRLVRVTLHELYLLPFNDSAYIDSPLSDLGLQQCEMLRAFLSKPCVDPKAESDFAALTSGEGYSRVVSSQLRRAASTVAIALSNRLGRTGEAISLVSSLQV